MTTLDLLRTLFGLSGDGGTVATAMRANPLTGRSSALRPFASLVAAFLSLLVIDPPAAIGATDTLCHGATVKEGRLWLTSDRTPLLTLLQDIGCAGNVPISVELGLRAELGQETVTTTMAGVLIEQGLRRLLPERHLVVVYEGEALAEVRVYGSFARPGSDTRLAVVTPLPARPKSREAPRAPSAQDLEQLARFREDYEASRLATGTAAPGATDDAAPEPSFEIALKWLAETRDMTRVERALDALRSAEDPPLEPLIRFATTDRYPDLRAQALELLSERGRHDPRIRDLLTSAAHDDKSETVRDAAAALLTSLDRP